MRPRTGALARLLVVLVVAGTVLPISTGSWTAFAQATTAPAPSAAGAAAVAHVDTASYELQARWDASTRQISGTATITYHNYSTDTLGELWLKLYLNAFRSEDTPWMREAAGQHRGSEFDPSQPGWIQLERLRLADTGEDILPPAIDPLATTVRVPLPSARTVGPGETVRLEVGWTSQLPRVFARTGIAGDYVMAGQWYPKLAVYDRGAWDTEPWHANSEFFADFGSYTLALTVPANYVTGATGARQDTTVNPDGSQTVTYWAESVSDVAWTAWPQYRTARRVVEVAGRTVELELLAPRTLGTSADERYFSAAGQTLELLGNWFGTYPWPKLTLVVPPPDALGAGGMEYPMLVTLALPVSAPFGLARGVHDVETVTVHEIAHQWVPLQLATNEGREAWLDEGFADYATTRVLGTIFPPDRSLLDLGPLRMGYEELHRTQYLAAAVKQPLAYPSWQYGSFLDYGATVYSKGTLVLLTLERTVGSERFLPAMKAHFDRWRWRHPTSADLQRSLEGDLGTSLDWFFKPFVFGTGVVEYRVADATADRAVVERTGDVAFPVSIGLTFTDGRTERASWDGASERLQLSGWQGALQRIQVDPDRAVGVEPNRLDDGRDVAPSPLPLTALAARLLGLVQAALLAGLLG